MTIELDHQTFDTAVADVRAGADAFHEARQRVGREVGALLDGGWSGLAAGSFADGWADWQAAAGDVLDGLLAMGHLLDAVHADLAARDADSQATLDRVALRISARLDP